MGSALTIVVLVVLLAISWRFLGSYMAAVFEGRVRWLSLVERRIYRVAGVDAKSEQTWKRYSERRRRHRGGSRADQGVPAQGVQDHWQLLG